MIADGFLVADMLMEQQTRGLINLLDFCQPITDVYCGQLTNDSV